VLRRSREVGTEGENGQGPRPGTVASRKSSGATATESGDVEKLLPASEPAGAGSGGAVGRSFRHKQGPQHVQERSQAQREGRESETA